MMNQIRTFLKVSPDKTNSDVIVEILMLSYAFLFIVVLVGSLVRDFIK
jgi:hypothetical protein